MSRRVLPRILMLLCLLPLGARAQQKLVAQRFIGAWKLISVEGEDPVFSLGYDHPSGMIIYDASGWMSAQIAVKGDRKPFARGLRSGTLEEKATAFDSFFRVLPDLHGRFGKENCTHHPENHSWLDAVEWTMSGGSSSRANDRLILMPVGDGREV